MVFWLVVSTPLKKKSVGMIIPNIWKNKKCFKPPTSFCIVRGSSVHHPSIPQDQRSKKTHGKTEPQCRSGYWMGQVPSGNLTELLCSWPLIC